MTSSLSGRRPCRGSLENPSSPRLCRYAISRRDIFERFLTDGRIELDFNVVERAIRPQAITRENSLFAGSDGGADLGRPSRRSCNRQR
ncbi:transposase [Rhizobium laguerreae]|nr:transposase [Rhizobium laguerreae]